MLRKLTLVLMVTSMSSTRFLSHHSKGNAFHCIDWRNRSGSKGGASTALWRRARGGRTIALVDPNWIAGSQEREGTKTRVNRHGHWAGCYNGLGHDPRSANLDRTTRVHSASDKLNRRAPRSEGAKVAHELAHPRDWSLCQAYQRPSEQIRVRRSGVMFTVIELCRVTGYLPRIVGLGLVLAIYGCGGGGSGNGLSASNPVPAISSLAPISAPAGSAAQTLTLNGSGFIPSSTVTYNGSARAAAYISAAQLTISLSAADQASAGAYPVVVTNPSPGGGVSNAMEFTISNPAPLVVITPGAGIVAAGAQLQFQASVNGMPTTAVVWQVSTITGGNTMLGKITNAGLYTAPTTAASVVITAVSQTAAAMTGAATVSVLAPHSIGVRATATIAEFFDRITGTVFVPRGNNYIRLATQTFPDGSLHGAHSTFNVGFYDPNGVETALMAMRASGYNTVRVFLNGCCHDNTIGNPAGGLSTAYLANVVDFLQRAKNHGVWVILEADWLPAFGGYTDNYAGCTQFSDFNTLNLCAGGVKGATIYFRDIVQGLINLSAPLEAILAYELRNEYFYELNFPPLSWTSGTVVTADGQTYDMSNAASRQQMMDNGLIYFTDQVRAGILALDPTALVEVGFFVPQGPIPTRIGDPRVITVYPAMANSTADFVSVHPYPFVGGLTLAQYVQNFGFVGYQQQKPVVMEEFGVLESNYPAESAAASVAHDWQVQSCAYGIKGWAFWTWDTSNAEQVDGPFWPASLGAGLIGQTLAPSARPNPCVN